MVKHILKFIFLLGTISFLFCAKKIPATVQTAAATSPAPPKEALPPVKLPKEAPKKIPSNVELVGIRRSSCFGSCPVYAAKLYADGRLVWVGKKNTPRIGTYETLVGPQFYQKIRAKANELGIFSLQNNYPTDSNPLVDLPTVTITLRAFAEESTPIKSIANNFGAPKELTEFEQYLDSLLDSLEWKETKN